MESTRRRENGAMVQIRYVYSARLVFLFMSPHADMPEVFNSRERSEDLCTVIRRMSRLGVLEKHGPAGRRRVSAA